MNIKPRAQRLIRIQRLVRLYWKLDELSEAASNRGDWHRASVIEIRLIHMIINNPEIVGEV